MKEHLIIAEIDPFKEIEDAAARVIRARVSSFFEGADTTITDGTPQQVGPYTVSILEKPAEKGDRITTFSASSNGLVLASHEVYRTASGLTLTDVATLYGAVDKQQVNLSAHRASGNNSVLVSFPDPHLVLPGRPHSSYIRAAKADYKAKVSKAFGIRI